MSQNTVTPKQYHPRPLEQILDFCVEFSRRMIVSGANVERVSIAIERICSTYELTDLSIFLLNTYVCVSAKDKYGFCAARRTQIPPSAINLRQLMSLNRLSYSVKENHPSPDRLRGLLEKACDLPDYPDPIVLLGQVGAMSCLCLIFGGWIPEVICVAIVTSLAHYLLILLGIPNLDKILTNAILMWISTSAVFLLSRIGLTNNKPVVIITALMLVIPGIPLVNAARSLLSGNEMSGILATLRVTVETMALATGIFFSLVMFGTADMLNNPMAGTITNPVLMVVLSFFTSFCLGVVFRMRARDLWLAGLGGALTRIVMISLSPVCTRVVFVTVSALTASAYAEILATFQKKPSTYYAYPSIIPLIPGDLFFLTLLGFNQNNFSLMRENAFNCALTLASMSIGFALCFAVAHYIRKARL